MDITIIEILIIILLLVFIIISSLFFHKHIVLERKLKILFSGKKVQDMETKILISLKQISEALETNEVIMKKIRRMQGQLDTAITKKSLVRYNPFNEVGSNQSFSICLLDSNNNGVIISALYSRGSSNFYAKEITAGIPKQTLSEEEQKVLIHSLEK